MSVMDCCGIRHATCAELGRHMREVHDVEPLPAAAPTCTVELAVADMIGVGQSLRMLAAQGRPNAETAAVFARVGGLMVDAAQEFILQRNREQQQARAAEFIEKATAPIGGDR